MELQEVIKPKLYTFKEVIAFMKISRNTLYRMIKSGRIKAIKVTMSGDKGVWMFRPEDVQAYYDSIHNPPDPGA